MKGEKSKKGKKGILNLLDGYPTALLRRGAGIPSYEWAHLFGECAQLQEIRDCEKLGTKHTVLGQVLAPAG